MKCDKPFIIAYDALFKYLDDFGGIQEIQEFWDLLGDAILGRFKELARTKGVAGLLEYWSSTLPYEGAKCSFYSEFNGREETLTIDIFECPSLRKMREEGIEPSEKYCCHCESLYGNALMSLGFDFGIQTKQGGCVLWIKKVL